MADGSAQGSALAWLGFSGLTVVTWGLYGLLLHSGQLAMKDPVNGRYRAFLFVGIAYVITAVLAPLAMLMSKGAGWSFPAAGIGWSLLAGAAGAAGAFGVLLAFGARGTPAVVMSIVFAGAPVVNAIAAMVIHPPAGGLGAIRWQFAAGILLAAAGGCLVTLYKPQTVPAPSATAQSVSATDGSRGR